MHPDLLSVFVRIKGEYKSVNISVANRLRYANILFLHLFHHNLDSHANCLQPTLNCFCCAPMICGQKTNRYTQPSP